MSDTKFPKVIIADFDRTLAYLYKDEELLQKLTVIMREYYSQFIDVPKTYFEDKHDGYFAWHALHKLAVEQLANGKTELANGKTELANGKTELANGKTELAKNLKNSVEDINRKAEQIVTAFETEILSKVGLIDGTVDTIVKLRKLGIRLGIVSNNAESAIRHALKLASVEEQFEYVGGRPYPFDPKLIKPNAYPIDCAVAALDADKAYVWYVGDDVSDMVAAKSAKVAAVGVSSGRHNKAQLLNAGADICLASFNEICAYLNNNFEKETL